MLGSSAAVRYGYSTARVKVMESRLIDAKTMNELISAKEVGAVITKLLQTDYRGDLETFGGVNIRRRHVDFALSGNMARSLGKLIRIAPVGERKIMRSILGKYALYNIKLAIEAKDKKKNYEDIEEFVVDFGQYGKAAIRDAMREDSVEGIISRLEINSPYRSILHQAVESYKKTHYADDALFAIDKGYYATLSKAILALRRINSESARIIKKDIDSVNLMLLIRAKRLGIKFNAVENSLIENGSTNIQQLMQLYNGTSDVESFVSEIKEFDMKRSLVQYRKNRHLIAFEIAMKNRVLQEGMKLLKHSMLSFGTLLAYVYMKEIEVYALRIAINSKAYGLSQEELSELMTWKQ